MPRRPRLASDSELRALAREEPERFVALVQALAPGVIAPKGSATVDDVDDPHLALRGRERIVDIVLRMGEDEVLHLEFHAYRDKAFGVKLLDYHVGLGQRYWGRVVSTVVVWLIKPPKKQFTNEIRMGSVTIWVEMMVLPLVAAAELLDKPGLACFAVGADPGAWTEEELCYRVAQAMDDQGATDQAWRAAEAIALVQKRIQPWRKAMKEVKPEFFIRNEFIRYGYQRGQKKGLKKGTQRGLGWLREALVETYRARFGDVLPTIHVAIRSVRNPKTLVAWQVMFATQSNAQIVATLGADAMRHTEQQSSNPG